MKKNIIKNYIFSGYILLILHLNVSTLSSLKTWMNFIFIKNMDEIESSQRSWKTCHISQ